MEGPVTCDVYYDYACPYVYRAGMWLAEVERQIPGEVTFRWRAFPLEQVNSDKGDDWRLWEQPDDFRSRSLPAFRAAEAAKRQEGDAFARFRLALLKLRHEDDRDHGKPETLVAAAESAGLDLDRFSSDLRDRALLVAVGEDYTAGRGGHGVFGTPTFVFPDGAAAYLKLSKVPDADQAVPIWREFVQTVVGRREIEEIKRPRKLDH